MSLFNKLHQNSGANSRKGLTARQFLGKDPKVKGYSTPDVFLQYATSLRQPELEQLEQVFKFCSEGLRIVGALITRTDKSKRSYQHPAFLLGNAQQGCKVIVEAGMKEFLLDYVAGTASINFTLEELIEECIND